MVEELIALIMDSVAYERNSDGTIKKKNANRSSVSLPLIDVDKTTANLNSITTDMLKEYDREYFFELVRNAVLHIKNSFVLSHDGFRKDSKGLNYSPVSLIEIYAFSIAASIMLENLSVYENSLPYGPIGIGVIEPAGQDCGKNLIKLAWAPIILMQGSITLIMIRIIWQEGKGK